MASNTGNVLLAIFIHQLDQTTIMSNDFEHSVQHIKHTLQSGQFANAIALAEQALQNNALLSEQKLELLYLKAVSLRYNRQIATAKSCLQQLLELSSKYARALQELGYCQVAENDISSALVSFHKAVETNPALIASWQQIVTLFRQQNHPNYQDAKKQFEILTALPKPVLAAMDLMHEGKLHKAEQICRKFLQQNKHQADAMCLLAEIGIQLKVFDDAEFLLESCVDLYPDNEQANASYIYLLNRLGKFALCAQHAERFLQNFNANSAINITVEATLANCYISLGKLDAGTNIYQQLLSKYPERAGLQVQLGHAYKTMGQEQKAIEAYQKAYSIDENLGDAYWSLANIKTYHFADAELEKMSELLGQPNVDNDSKVHINFALGKAYEDNREFKTSFDYYAQGNALKKQLLGYDADNTSKLIEQQIQHCSKELFEQRADLGEPDQAPIFIVGLPRAGSTLLEQILASHSMVDGTMELHNILAIALKLRGRIANGESQYPQNLWNLDPAVIKQFGQSFIRDTHTYRQGAPYFIDKMPNNFIHIGLIKLILPNAKIIDARRDPMACCFSGFKQLFGEGQDFSYDLEDIAQYYQDYLKLMNHWHQVLPGQILTVQHEDLVHNFEHVVKRLLDYCQLPFEQSCLEFYNTKRNIHTPSAQQVRQPISTKGLEQWKNYEAYLSPLQKHFN